MPALIGFQQLQFHSSVSSCALQGEWIALEICKNFQLKSYLHTHVDKLWASSPCKVCPKPDCLSSTIFFQRSEHQYPINFCHITFTLKLKANFLTWPVSNTNYKAKPPLLNLGMSTKFQPNYFNSNVTIFSNFGFMSSFLKERLPHMVVNSLWIKSLPPLQQWVQKVQRPITGIRYLPN